MAYYISSGIISSGIALYNGSMYVSSGGAANHTTVNYSGYMDVSSGGTANHTTVNSSGVMRIYSGGTANSTTVDSGGLMLTGRGGTANSTTINPGGSMRISSGGTATAIKENGGYVDVEDGANVSFVSNTISGLTLSNASMTVHDNTIANTTTISGGRMDICTGGTANSTIVYGDMYISSGGTANSTVVGSRGSMFISSGGVASTITVNNWGRVYISSGGTANRITVNSQGSIFISSGGSATDIIWTPCIGAVSAANGAWVTFASDYSGIYFGSDNRLLSHTATMTGRELEYGGNSMYIMSGGVANSTAVNSSGYMYIYSGGVANSTAVNSSGCMYIYSGGVANSTTVEGYGSPRVYVFNGGSANCTLLTHGSMYISSGGAVNSTVVGSRGSMYISSGGTAANIFWTPCIGEISEENGACTTYASSYSGIYFGSNNQLLSHTESMTGQVLSGHSMYVMSGGVANYTTLDGWGSMYISSGGVTDSTTISRGRMNICNGGVANSTTITSRGSMYINSGGEANGTTLSEYGANIYICSGGTANSTTMSGGYMCISSGGTANDTTMSGGSMFISSGGTANSTFVMEYVSMYISSGGVANDTTMSGGYLRISSGGVANNTVNLRGGMDICYGGVANSTTMSGGGMYISYGGVANSTTMSGGYINISSGGVANNTTMSGGYMYISSGGVANSTAITSRGYMYISSGGVHRGSLQIESGAVVSAYSGSIIDFTVADRTASDGYLINDLSLVSGAPTYTITVSTTQAEGTYKLAQGAANFNETISIGDGTTDYGSITVNGDDLVRNGVTYSLDQADGNLTLTVTGAPVPTVSNLTGNANGVSWSGNGSAFVVEYSKDNFANVIKLETTTNKIDTYNIGAGAWQVRVDSEAQTSFTAAAPAGSAAQIVSDADGDLDVFFARTAGIWDAKHLAKHLGDFNGWRGTNERVALTGKNIITDVFAGSTDANVLVLTDDSNGDALFLDDAFTALGNQARLGNIDEIRAGAGSDVIDLTSPKFAYLGDEMTVYGGSGNDTIWANSGENTLYGDAGNDRIIGGAGNDFIIGGAGNDALHGGGGNDTFCFGANWGTDTVEQLASGKVILRFETGSMSNWNAASGIYSDGNNTVTVTGTNDIELYFGTASTLPEDAFAPAASNKIFEQLA